LLLAKRFQIHNISTVLPLKISIEGITSRQS
jgi:hypothetical protein